MNDLKVIIVLSHLPILLTVIYAAFCFKKLGRELKVFSYYIFFSGIVQFSALFLWFARKNNMPLLHLYVPVGFVMLAWFYATLLKGFVNTKIIWSTAMLFLLFSITNTLFFQDVFTFNSNDLTVESILITILALFTFNFFLNSIVKKSIGDDIKSLNWINSALFIYNSADLLIFYFGNSIIRNFSYDLNLYTWVLHSFFSMVMYTFFLISLWKRSRT